MQPSRNGNPALLIHCQKLAFFIHRFCGGRIEFDPAEACSCSGRIDIQRTYRNGRIVYITRPAAEDAEETNPDDP